MKISRKRMAVATVALAAIAGGTAFAYWTQGGAGAGTAQTGTTTAITVNQTTTVTGLYPGGPAAPLAGDFNNPNGHDVTVARVTAVVRAFSSQTDVNKPACTEADFAIAGAANGLYTVPTGNGVGGWSGLTVAMIDNQANQDNCKSVTIDIDYTAEAV